MNRYRQLIDLSGFWDFRFDPKDEGLNSRWQNGFEDELPIAVPASWNEQFADFRDFLGPSWYQRDIFIPPEWSEKKIFLRFGSVNYISDVWLNGKKIGNHEGGHLPFEFDITDKINFENDKLIVRVDGTLKKEHVPPSGRQLNYPHTNFDFFPYCGIHRPVFLYNIPKFGITDLTVITTIDGERGNVQVKINKGDNQEVKALITISGHKSNISKEVLFEGHTVTETLIVEKAALWSPESPNLYDLKVELSQKEKIYDSYSLPIGIRTIEVKGTQILLNGNPIYLKGFGRHEDFPVVGRGFLPALIIKDFSLLKWIGANSFRTSHYPYSEQMMDLADRLGFMVINETPAVGLTFISNYYNQHLELCQQYIRDLVRRDKNHPSVIMWSLANEPGKSNKSKEFFKQLYETAIKEDQTRPVTLVSMVGASEKAFEFLDVVCLNRYNGWYVQSGRIDEGIEVLSEELDKIHAKYKKPMILSEFGTDTLPGCHSQPPEMWSEEYQVEFIKKYIALLKTKNYVVGEHIWNMCDFKTSQGILRAGGLNHKGVFTRDRRPKLAAHLLRKLWKKEALWD